MTFSFSCKDDQGRHEVGMVENTVKTPIGMNQEGCLFEARWIYTLRFRVDFLFRFEIKKLPGNFHLSTHSVDVQPDEYDFGHIIHEVNNRKQIFYLCYIFQVSFGSKIKKISGKMTKSSFNPLRGRERTDGNSLESHE